MSQVSPPKEPPARPAWNLALIGGEVVLLAAITGVGIHLAMQPHRAQFRPPPLVLPSAGAVAMPVIGTPPIPPRPAASPSPSRPSLGAELFARFGQQDRSLLVDQWEIIQRVTGAVELYIEEKLNEIEKKR